MINVRCACGLCAEWALVELQGEVEVETEELLNSLDVGRLCKAAAGTLTLTVGYHELEGKLAQLPKPLAVLQQVSETGGTSFEVVGVIRYKYRFSTRPKALISKPDVKRPRSLNESGFANLFSRKV